MKMMIKKLILMGLLIGVIAPMCVDANFSSSMPVVLADVAPDPMQDAFIGGIILVMCIVAIEKATSLFESVRQEAPRYFEKTRDQWQKFIDELDYIT